MNEKAGKAPEPSARPSSVSGSDPDLHLFCCYAPSVSFVGLHSWRVSYCYLWKENDFLHLSALFLMHVSTTYRVHDLDQVIVLNIRFHQYRRVFLLRVPGFQA